MKHLNFKIRKSPAVNRPRRNSLLEKVYPSNFECFRVLDLLIDMEGEVILAGSLRKNPMLVKRDADGEEVWNLTSNKGISLKYIVENGNGDIVCIGNTNKYNELLFMVVSPSGILIIDEIIQLPANYYLYRIIGIEILSNHDFAVTIGYARNDSKEYADILKINLSGHLLSKITIGDGVTNCIPLTTQFFPNGELLLAYKEYGTDGIHLRMTKIKPDGIVIWDKYINKKRTNSQVMDLENSQNRSPDNKLINPLLSFDLKSNPTDKIDLQDPEGNYVLFMI